MVLCSLPPPSWAGESPIQSRSSPSNLEHLPQSFLNTQAQKARTQSESVNSCQLILSNMCNRLPHHLPHRKSHQSALSVVLRSHQPRAHIRRSRPKGDDGTAYLRRSSRAAVARCRAEPWTSKGRKRFLLSVEDVWIIFQKTSSYQMYPNVECVRMCSLDQPTSSLSLEQSAASAEEVTWFEFVSSMLLNWSHEARANTHAICLGWHLEPSGQKKCHPSSSDAENNISSWVDFLHLTPFPKRIEMSL